MLKSNRLIGFGARRSSVATWGIVWSNALGTNRGGYDGFTVRDVFAIAGLTVPSGTVTKIRVTYSSGTGENLTVSNAYAGTQAGSGDPYDFSATPTQILFSGAASKTITAGTDFLSDEMTFSWDKTSPLVLAGYFGGGASNDTLNTAAAAISNLTEYSKAGSDAATVNATGYATDTARSGAIKKIEMTGF